MFEDKDGGNVTTQRNAEKGIFAKKTEEYDRTDYDYSAMKKEKQREAFGSFKVKSPHFEDSYTGKKEKTYRENSNGKQVMNAELDHLHPLKDIHGQGGWMRDKDGRTKLSSISENLHYTTHETNRGKSAKSPEEALSKDQGFDPDRIKPMIEKARTAVKEELPTDWDRLKYHSNELVIEGSKEAGKNALRQAMGLLLQEFVNGSYLEVRAIVLAPVPSENLVDRVGAALERTVQRVTNKTQDAFNALISGGLQGAVSNLLTFLINNFITTSAKIVKIIRESLASLWRALKFLCSPPEHMSEIDVAREVTKIIAGVITTSLGLLFEEAVKGFIFAFPLLAPIAGILAPAITGLLIGLTTALAVYAIDRLFDWLADPGTEMLNAQIGVLDAQTEVAGKLEDFMEQQYANSKRYQDLIDSCQAMTRDLSASEAHLQATTASVNTAREVRLTTTSMMREGLENWERNDSELSRLISDYKLEE